MRARRRDQIAGRPEGRGLPATRRRARTVLAVVASLMAAGVGLVAQGAPASADQGARHCVVRAGAAAAQCFASTAEAVRVASGNAVSLPATATVADAVKALKAHDRTLARSLTAARAPSGFAASSSTVIGIEYDGNNQSGSSIVFTGGSGCYSGQSYGFPRLSSYGWNDRINSASTFAGCIGKHYDDTNYRDTMVSVFGSRDSFGTMNNKTSSILFY